ncbi:MAG: nicotinate phosphoribosyltransferase [Thioalkalivibrio sp.]|nr:MAG: nicotinate phosphoribosyltransferase [Thioalkalivibrio sp.]
MNRADPQAPVTACDRELALFTDLYELTMLQAYLEEGMHDSAVFSLFVRRVPPGRNYLLACGLDSLLGQLEDLRFEQKDLAYLASLGLFSGRFLGWLADLRFTGDVYAVKEGTPVFANEPILEIVAPLPEAQLVETLVMNQIHLQTVLATKAARLVSAAAGRPVLDFGARRIHGIDAAMKGARAFHIAGVAGTSNVLAGRVYGVPVRGTMAHSYIQAHDAESEAFEAFARLYPDTVLLVDTYDTLEGIRRVVDLQERLGEKFRISAVRLDSGDLDALSRGSRRILDAAGLEGIEVFASGGLDEHEIQRLVSAGAPIDGFGVGTSMGISSDVPDLDIAYKLAEYAGKGRLKLSSGKPILPGRKQVFREQRDGVFTGDVIGRWDEEGSGDPLLSKVMEGGTRLDTHERDLNRLREHAAASVAGLPQTVRAIASAEPPYPVRVSDALAEHQRAVREAIAEEGRGAG